MTKYVLKVAAASCLGALGAAAVIYILIAVTIWDYPLEIPAWPPETRLLGFSVMILGGMGAAAAAGTSKWARK